MQSFDQNLFIGTQTIGMEEFDRRFFRAAESHARSASMKYANALDLLFSEPMYWLALVCFAWGF